jgi:hypothetical protein
MPRISASLDWDKRDWRRPQSGDLLFDAQDLYKKSIRSPKRAVQARYGRASLILGVAAIEAISNDTLASIYELLMDAWPSECVAFADLACLGLLCSLKLPAWRCCAELD